MGECEGSLSCTVSIPAAVGQDNAAITAGGGWGAFPGLYTKEKCGSGLGCIGNIGDKRGYAKTVVRSPCVNSFADISQDPPAIVSDILCSMFLSGGSVQATWRLFSILTLACLSPFQSLVNFVTCRKRGYQQLK